MKKLLVGLMILTSISTYAGDKIFSNFASCSSKMDGTSVTLDFFEEYKVGQEKPTGNGYIIQTIGQIKVMSNMKIKEIKKGKEIVMFTALEPSDVFASFKINMKNKSKVEIFANSYQQVWGTFKCVPRSL
jgi:hypothetical protein